MIIRSFIVAERISGRRSGIVKIINGKQKRYNERPDPMPHEIATIS